MPCPPSLPYLSPSLVLSLSFSSAMAETLASAILQILVDFGNALFRRAAQEDRRDLISLLIHLFVLGSRESTRNRRFPPLGSDAGELDSGRLGPPLASPTSPSRSW